MGYEELLTEADKEGLLIKEKPLQTTDGLCKGNRIAIRKDIPTLAQKADVLAEELGHYHTTVGNIIELQTAGDEKQERTARLWAYNKRIGLCRIIKAYKNQCMNSFEIAELLDVSEDFLNDALDCYRHIYGNGIKVDNYLIRFEPRLQVYEYQNI